MKKSKILKIKKRLENSLKTINKLLDKFDESIINDDKTISQFKIKRKKNKKKWISL